MVGLLASACYLAERYLCHGPVAHPMLWPAPALGALAILRSRRSWPLALVFSLACTAGAGPGQAWSHMALGTVTDLLAAVVAARLLGQRPISATWLAALVATALGVGALSGLLLGALGGHSSFAHRSLDLGAAYATGFLVVLPLGVAALQSPGRLLARTLAATALAAVAAEAIVQRIPAHHDLYLEVFSFLAVSWFTVAAGRLAGAASASALALGCLASASHQLGPFVGVGEHGGHWQAQVFGAALTVASALISALLAEGAEARRELMAAEHDLRTFYERQIVGQPGLVGEAYLRALAEHVAHCFGARYGLIGEVLPDGQIIRTFAVWFGDQYGETADYTIAGTPCEQVLAHGIQAYLSNVVSQFPNAPVLAELGAQSYIGVPVVGENGEPLGVLAAVHTEPLAPLDERSVALLATLAARAASELQRLRAESALRQSQQQYRNLVEQATAIIISWQPDGRLTFVNRFALDFFGYEEHELLGQPMIGTIIPRVDETGADLEAMVAGIVNDPDRYASNYNENMRRDGSRAWLAWSNVAICDDQGQVVELLSVGYDLTALRNAEAEVRASADRVRATLDRSPFGAIVYEVADDDTLRLVGYNDAAARILCQDLAALLGRTIEEAFPPLAATALPATFRRLAIEGGTYIDANVPYADASVTGHYQIYAYQIAPRQMTVMFHETSERDLIQARLYRRNRELNLLNRVIALSSAEMDPVTVLGVACEELADALDLPYVCAAVVTERTAHLEFVAERHPDDDQPVGSRNIPIEDLPLLAAALARGVPIIGSTADQLAQAMDAPLLAIRGLGSGAVLPLMAEGEAVGCLFLGDTKPRTLATEDIALAWGVAQQIGSAVARNRLTASRRHLTVAIEQTPDSIVVTDPQGYIQYVNPAFEAISGYSAAEVMGRPTRILKSGMHDDSHYADLWRTVSAGQVWTGRLINRRSDGSLYTESAVIAPVRDETGTITNYIAVKRDITAELELEDHYRQSQKLESIGRLAGGIAHDFNNILTAMIGHAESADQMLGARHPAREELSGVLLACQRAASLTRQLLAFARRQVVQPVVFDLGNMATGLSSMLRRLIGEDIDLRVPVPEQPLPVLADAGQMEQVLVNLTVNARDAMPGGGSLRIEAWRDGAQVALSVTDTGTGIAPDVLPRIFDPFYTTKGEGQGTGLGLATCYGIVQQAGGDITCDSVVGQGTTFTIRLPLAHGLEEDGGSEEVMAQRGTETILLVEDEEPVRVIATRQLQSLGYTVLTASAGMEALNLAAQYPARIHLLISDMVMPEMNGLALAGALARSRPETRLLLMTGYIGDQAFQDADAFARHPHLHKPFTRVELADKVREVLA